MIDLDAYLDRIGLAGTPEPTADALATLHLAHLEHIPFENIDVRLRRPIGLDLDSLVTKLVRARRGGYCFEHNTLFAAVLRVLGFEVSTLEARVRPPGATRPLPRTHMTLEVRVGERAWLADVGFGGSGPLLPVPLDGSRSEQPDGAYAVHREDAGTFVLRRGERGEWRDLYAFTRTPALPVDFEVAHHFTSTHPGSPFLETLTVQRSEPSARYMLRGRTYTVLAGGDESVREIGREELTALLRGSFRLDIPEEEARRALGGD